MERTEPATSAAPARPRPTVTRASVTGDDPNRFDSRTRSRRPPRVGLTINRTVSFTTGEPARAGAAPQAASQPDAPRAVSPSAPRTAKPVSASTKVAESRRFIGLL